MRSKNIYGKIIFIIYSLLLVWLILFKMAFSLEDIELFKGAVEFNLIPFYYDNETGRTHMREVVMNVIVFVPFGVYLNMLVNSLKKTILFGFAASLGFELMQLVLAIGSFDITDLLTNTTGALVGGAVYLLIGKIVRDKSKRDKLINVLATVMLSATMVLAALLIVANS